MKNIKSLLFSLFSGLVLFSSPARSGEVEFAPGVSAVLSVQDNRVEGSPWSVLTGRVSETASGLTGEFPSPDGVPLAFNLETAQTDGRMRTSFDWKRVAKILEPLDREIVFSVECGTIEQAERSLDFLSRELAPWLA